MGVRFPFIAATLARIPPRALPEVACRPVELQRCFKIQTLEGTIDGRVRFRMRYLAAQIPPQ
jgi:hypothetical protein